MPSDAAQTLYEVLVVDSIFLVLTLLLFWAGVFVARRLGRGAGYGLGALGLARPRGGYFVGVALGLAVGVGALIGSLFITPLSMYVLERLGYSTESNVQQELLRGVQGWVAESPGRAIPAAVFVIVVFAPAVEEIIFRGALFGGLYKLGTLLSERLARGKDTGGKGGGKVLAFAVAALLSSTFFALLHLEPVALPAILVLAVALCALYWRTGSLVSTFVAHATFNSFAVLIIVLMGSGVLPMPA
jgi:uncharacterized protein